MLLEAEEILNKLPVSIGGQEYQPGTPGIYQVVEYFERFWGVN